MSSSCAQSGDFFAGKQPAVKAGGMRIKQPRHVEDKSPKPTAEEAAANQVKETNEDGKEIVAATGGSHHSEFSTEAVKSSHSKPHPCHEKPIMNKQINKTIQQPR